jgi:hypothetical protein
MIELYGLKVVTDDSLKKVPRSLRERLFSRPWRPFRAFNLVPRIEDGFTLKFGDKLMMNSKTKNTLLAALSKEKP